MIRTPRERWFQLDSSHNGLTIHAQPSFIGRRQQHATATATTVMHYTPRRSGDVAGLVAFQSDSFYYVLGETLHDGKPVVRLLRRAGGRDQGREAIVAEASLATKPNDSLYLRIQARGAQYDFLYAEHPGDWRWLARNVDGTILSTHVAGGFVGTMIGMYAYSPP